jgi:hypothetical protein
MHTATAPDREAEAVESIEELIAEYGLPGLLRAVLKSALGDKLNQAGSAQDSLRIIQVILRQITYAPNPQLEAEIMALGCGLILFDHNGIRATARRWGLTPAAVSKRVIEFAEANHLPPSQYMRSIKDRETYAKTNRPRTK